MQVFAGAEVQLDDVVLGLRLIELAVGGQIGEAAQRHRAFGTRKRQDERVWFLGHYTGPRIRTALQKNADQDLVVPEKLRLRGDFTNQLVQLFQQVSFPADLLAG